MTWQKAFGQQSEVLRQDRDVSLRKALTAVRNDFARRGVLDSSTFFNAAIETATQELDERARVLTSIMVDLAKAVRKLSLTDAVPALEKEILTHGDVIPRVMRELIGTPERRGLQNSAMYGDMTLERSKREIAVRERQRLSVALAEVEAERRRATIAQWKWIAPLIVSIISMIIAFVALFGS